MEIENKILKIRKENPNYGYRRITAMLKRLGLKINKKKVQRLVQNLKLRVKDFFKKIKKIIILQRTSRKNSRQQNKKKL
ncbi:MAG: IS3 family transposase [Finegoldia magna]|nr:IS3 family transposase [Finegoldia magna]MDU4731925.1 IS3 family transposase [Finegoldia magna]MDU5272456.1 IS3 family transposase [Finegoldia magna]MDU5441797.1 IS3 family transposase [Finegoldia magna]MDU7140145.1 IS3 family transposase [Finegoldia magna]